MDVFILDQKTAPVFAGLYPGDFSRIFDEDHISYGVISEDVAAGLLVSRMEDEDLVIEWVYTLPDKRKKGIASALVERLLRDLKELGYILEVHAACQGEQQKAFFERMGFLFAEEPAGMTYTAELDEITDIPEGRRTDDCHRLIDLGNAELRNLNDALFRAEEAAFGVKLPVVPLDYAPYSYAYMKEKKLLALVLMKKEAASFVDIAYAYREEGAMVPLLTIFSVIRAELEEKYPDGILIRATGINDASRALLEHVAPGAEQEPVYLGSRLAY